MKTTAFVLVLGLLICGVSALVVWWAARNAPEGFEDEHGFHFARGRQREVPKIRHAEERPVATSLTVTVE